MQGFFFSRERGMDLSSKRKKNKARVCVCVRHGGVLVSPFCAPRTRVSHTFSLTPSDQLDLQCFTSTQLNVFYFFSFSSPYSRRGAPFISI